MDKGSVFCNKSLEALNSAACVIPTHDGQVLASYLRVSHVVAGATRNERRLYSQASYPILFLCPVLHGKSIYMSLA